MHALGTDSASRLHGLMKRQVTACSMMKLVCTICSCLSTVCLLPMHCLQAMLTEADRCRDVSKD